MGFGEHKEPTLAAGCRAEWGFRSIVLDAMGDIIGVKHEFTNPVLYYGQDYTLVPDHTGPAT